MIDVTNGFMVLFVACVPIFYRHCGMMTSLIFYSSNYDVSGLRYILHVAFMS